MAKYELRVEKLHDAIKIDSNQYRLSQKSKYTDRTSYYSYIYSKAEQFVIFRVIFALQAIFCFKLYFCIVIICFRLHDP